MVDRYEITAQELSLIISGLEDAMYYRDVRSHASKNVVRDEDKAKAKAYSELLMKLKRVSAGA